MSLEVIERLIGEPKVWRCISRILERNLLCAIATVTPRGEAHVNTAYFAYSADLEFYFYSYRDTGHAVNLEENPSMAMAVFDSDQAWGRPDRGLQLFGTARVALGESARKAAGIYDRRFPGHAQWRQPSLTAESSGPPAAYRFRPSAVKLFDERAFGAGVFVRATVPRRLGSPRRGVAAPSGGGRRRSGLRS
jgi:uncharacterized protein YhbP (UPF0306 family)